MLQPLSPLPQNINLSCVTPKIHVEFCQATIRVSPLLLYMEKFNRNFY